MPADNSNPVPSTTKTTLDEKSDSVVNNPVVVKPGDPEKPADDSVKAPVDIPTEVAHKIGESHNVLIALSSDPSVDEMSAAIGLSMYLDRIGKRATAIYSGKTPNALEFLRPEETFEPTADSLQDFVIALNKEKADHLRYKLDGEFVKIYITPYRNRISEKDLEYSYGDFNVDLVLALDVANGVDLDQALREHGRIMHDAVIINITTGDPGKLGEIEWSDKEASSVSEMITKLLYSITDSKIEKEEATAFLTGIVAATNRFSNNKTTPETMKVSSRLMESGANQQLVSKNITPDVENEMINMGVSSGSSSGNEEDPTKLDITHDDKEPKVEEEETEEEPNPSETPKVVDANLNQAATEETLEANQTSPEVTAPDIEQTTPELATLDTDQSSSEINAPGIGQIASEVTESNVANEEPALNVETQSPQPPELSSELPEPPIEQNSSTPVEPPSYLPGNDTYNVPAPETNTQQNVPSEGYIFDGPEKVIQPPADFAADSFSAEENNSRYSQMLENALESAEAPAEPAIQTTPIISSGDNPATVSTPNVPLNPEINGVPEINYTPSPNEPILSPPPAPPINTNLNTNPGVDTSVNPMPMPPVDSIPPVDNMQTIPPVQSVPSMQSVSQMQPVTPPSIPQAMPVELPAPEPVTPQPSAQEPITQDQTATPQTTSPDAFKIPGM